ncbi:molybdopterin cofactor-binding domain-containing protein [Streptomyces sp. NPDC002159]
MSASPAASEIPASLAANPRLSSWLRFTQEGEVEVRSGKVELGQGVLTALAQIAAEELDVDMSRIRMTAATTGTSPDEGLTAGSLSIQHSGAALRIASAEAKAIYLARAAEQLECDASKLTVVDGLITAPDGQATSYWRLADDALLDRSATGTVTPKAASTYRVVGTDAPRVDLPDKLTGRPRFAHDLVLPGLLYGRVVRPPSRGSTLKTVDTAPVLDLPGVVTTVRDGNFLAVVADREEVALRAVEVLRKGAVWQQQPTLPDEEDMPTFLMTAPLETTLLAEVGKRPPESDVSRTREATYHRPYIAHASMGPSSATAHLTTDNGEARLCVWTHSQGVYLLRRELSRALGMSEEQITVSHVEGPGCYGHNGADDSAMDAALLALAVPDRPVQVVWSRHDELTWSPFGPAAVVKVSADVGPDGEVLAWEQEIWGNTHITRPGLVPSVAFLAASHREGGKEIAAGPEASLDHGGAAGRNSVPGYGFPYRKAVNHRVVPMPLRTSSLRSLGAFVNVFAAESFMDELALEAGRDPIEFRLAHLTDPRGRALLETVARRADWAGRPASDSVGYGVAYARYKNSSAYCAVIAEVEAVNEVRVRRLTLAVDAGLVISPDGARNQIEGGAVQATSWTLKERVRFNRMTVTSDDWETYPILRFSAVPAVHVELMPDGGNPPLGVGETAQGPTAAAIANAIHDALGVRVRCLPLTEEQIVAAMPD